MKKIISKIIPLAIDIIIGLFLSLYLGYKKPAPSYLEAVKNSPDAGKCISETLSVKVGALKLPLVLLTNQSITFLTGWAKLLKNEHCIVKHERCQSPVMKKNPNNQLSLPSEGRRGQPYKLMI